MSDLMMSTLKPSLSFTEMDFAELNESAIENSSLGFLFGMPFSDNFPSFSPAEFPKTAFEPETTKKRKLEAAMAGDQKLKRRKQCFKGSVVRSSLPKDGEKQKGVVHVRARRGQATDSHSLAERVRRERINEKMRCLQDLVPGCCKTMGMASMLDEIINYVQSLQNQVEFLSMKLSAASTFYDFDLDVESMPISIPKQMRNGQSEAGDAERDQVYGDLIGFSSALPF